MLGLWPWIEILSSRGHESQSNTQLAAATFDCLFTCVIYWHLHSFDFACIPGQLE